VYPVTVKRAPPDSDADAVAGVSDPLAQLRETVTLAGLLSEKSLLTVKLALFSVFTTVHVPALRAATQVPEDE